MTDTRVLDPLGRAIMLHDRTWFGHILKAHPEMDQCRALVERALADPGEIRLSRSDPDCRIYFGPGPRTGVMMMVVVDVVVCLVKTAHMARQASGGTQEWSK